VAYCQVLRRFFSEILRDLRIWRTLVRCYGKWVYLGVGGNAIATVQTINDSAKMDRQKCQPFAKLKELQANAFAAHLILPNRTKTPPTT